MVEICYFIGAEHGPVKIGRMKVAPLRRPEHRLKEIQNGNPTKLMFLASSNGGASDERRYHDLFAEARLNGEWFERTPEIEAEIQRLVAQSMWPIVIPTNRLSD